VHAAGKLRRPAMQKPERRWLMFILATLQPGMIISCGSPDTTVEHADLALEARIEGLRDPTAFVVGGSVDPVWLEDGNRFWFVKHGSAGESLVVVDPVSNTVSPPISLGDLNTRLLELGEDIGVRSVAPSAVEPLNSSLDSLRIWVGERAFLVLAGSVSVSLEGDRPEPPAAPSSCSQNRMATDGPPLEAFVRDDNLWVRDLGTGAERKVTADGTESLSWQDPSRPPPSPGSNFTSDGRYGVFLKAVSFPQGTRRVPHFAQNDALQLWKNGPDTPPDGEPQFVGWWNIPGPNRRPFLVDLEDGSSTPLPVPDPRRTCLDETGQGFPCREIYHFIGWLPNGSEFLFTQTFQDAHPEHLDELQGHDLRLLAFDPRTSETRTVLAEGEDLHVLTSGQASMSGGFWLLSDRTFLWLSERDGWRHIYRLDLEGRILSRVTSGSFPVDWIKAVDEEQGWVYFTATDDPERPYDRHLYRVRLDGSGFARLTEAPGVHEAGVHQSIPEAGVGIDLSPSLEYFLDSHSAVDRPPTVELRKSDGTLVRVVDQADISRLEDELGWNPPEEFVVKDADGATDLYGVLYRPTDFDPDASYPVIQLIHNLPGAYLVEHAFSPAGKGLSNRFELRGLAEMGFVIVKVDTRGTGGRGRAFSDWAFLPNEEGDRITEDHVAALRHLAADRPWMDLSRVGIIGISRGSLQALRAMTMAPDVYGAGVTVSTIVGTGHPWELSPSGVIPFLGNMEAMHLMIQGTEDSGWIDVLRLSEEYRRLGKQHRVVILPGAGHVPQGEDRAFMNATIRDFFSRMSWN
jgi:dipeptidyl aminopeptidase/acylaminoacyl peptidase